MLCYSPLPLNSLLAPKRFTALNVPICLCTTQVIISVRMSLQTLPVKVTKYFRAIHIYKPPSKLSLFNSEDIDVYIVELKDIMAIFIPLIS